MLNEIEIYQIAKKVAWYRHRPHLEELINSKGDFHNEIYLKLYQMEFESPLHCFRTAHIAASQLICKAIKQRKGTWTINDDLSSLYDDVMMSECQPDIIEKSETDLAVIAKLNNLPIEHRLIVEMYYMQDMTDEQIANQLGTTRQNITDKRNKIFNKLKDLLAFAK